MTKVVIIGAGSQFGGKLSKDILSIPNLQNDVTIALCDINAVKLQNAYDYVKKIIDGHGLRAQVEQSVDRSALLPGADFVVTSIAAGGPAYAGFPFTSEINIPFEKYGISQFVADTIGIGGIFRFLRTAPIQVDICRDMERLCPSALLINYTNPMAMLTWAHSTQTSIKNVGLCHSVQHTVHELSRYLGIDESDVEFACAGINHQAWFTKFSCAGEDQYPALRKLLGDPDTVAKDHVRFEMMRYFGRFVTESSWHCSEYHPYFRRTAELRDRYGLKQMEARETDGRVPLPVGPDDPLPALDRSEEYASGIINAVSKSEDYVFYGNVMNTGRYIENLPENCCVEVKCTANASSVVPHTFGALPTQLMHLNMTNIAVQQLAVEAFATGDKELAFHACALDPLARSVLSLDQLRSMFEELWTAEKELLTSFDG